jgi:hypothetical protein
MRLSGLARLLVLACALSGSLAIKQAGAQCAAQEAMGNGRLLAGSSFSPASEAVQPAAGIPVWKTVKVGTVASKWDLHRALDAANCGIGDSAEQIFAQPQFAVSSARIDADLVRISVAELGLQSASLGEVYARAQSLGFALAAPEIGPQLRLQYFEQPIGESLDIGMAPIATDDGKPEIFVVANGGAGLLLVGADAGEAMRFHSAARFVFVRQRNVASSQAKSD